MCFGSAPEEVVKVLCNFDNMVGWNGIQSPDSVINIHRRIACESWSGLKISLGTEATYEDDHVVDDGR